MQMPSGCFNKLKKTKTEYHQGQTENSWGLWFVSVLFWKYWRWPKGNSKMITEINKILLKEWWKEIPSTLSSNKEFSLKVF